MLELLKIWLAGAKAIAAFLLVVTFFAAASHFEIIPYILSVVAVFLIPYFFGRVLRQES